MGKNKDEIGKIATIYALKYIFYEEAEAKIKAKIKKREAQIMRLKKKEDKLTYPHWMENYLKPLAEKLLGEPELKGYYFDLLGPFGMNCETSVHFYPTACKQADNKEFWDIADKNGGVLSLSFRPGELEKGELFLVDYATDTQRFCKGSIGEMNGGNHPSIPMKKTIRELVAYMLSKKEAHL